MDRKCTPVAYKLQSSFRRPGGLPIRPLAAAPRLVFLNWVVFLHERPKFADDMGRSLALKPRQPRPLGSVRRSVGGGLITPCRAVGVFSGLPPLRVRSSAAQRKGLASSGGDSPPKGLLPSDILSELTCGDGGASGICVNGCTFRGCAGPCRVRPRRKSSKRFPLALLRRALVARSYGSSRIRRFLNSIGEPSDSRQTKPLAGSQPVPPETSSPLTHNRTSPLMARM